MTVSEWLLAYLRQSTLPGWLFYNNAEDGVDKMTIIENIGDRSEITFVDGSCIADNPFMLVITCNQEEAAELEQQAVFDEFCDWIKKNDPAGATIDEDKQLGVVLLKPATNLAIVGRDDSGNAQYQALFNFKYFKGAD